MSRGQQGIGISTASMYGQLTSGKPTRIISLTGKGKAAYLYEIQIDTTRNKPTIVRDSEERWEVTRGTAVEIEMEARYLRGRQSVDEYLRQTALVNPHLTLRYKSPDGREIEYENSARELPPEPVEVKPHPHGVELGMLMKMMHGSIHRSFKAFLAQEFSRVSSRAAKEICERAQIKPKARPKSIARE